MVKDKRLSTIFADIIRDGHETFWAETETRPRSQ